MYDPPSKLWPVRIIAPILIILGIIFVATNIRDEQRGVTTVYAPAGRSYNHQVVVRAEKPEEFQNAMKYQWLRAFAPIFLGAVGVHLCRRADRLDPFSPNFAGNAELDELGRELDQERERRSDPRYL
jgi:hypothetical protein